VRKEKRRKMAVNPRTYPCQDNDYDNLHDDKSQTENKGLLPPALKLRWVPVVSCLESLHMHMGKILVGRLEE